MNTRPLLTALLAASAVGQAHANIDVQFDYTYDTAGFFADSNRKAVLESVAADPLCEPALRAFIARGLHRLAERSPDDRAPLLSTRL